jgi:hypothetical protein
MRLHRTDNLRLIAQFAITTISRPESATGVSWQTGTSLRSVVGVSGRMG